MGAIKITKWDKAFSNWIRERDGWKCQRCSRPFNPDNKPSLKGLHCSHVYGRANWQIRLEPANAMSLCYGCHRFVGSNPIEHIELWKKKFSKSERDDIIAKKEAKGIDRIKKRLIQSDERLQQIKNKTGVYKC
jgi:hypothetical protein